MSDHRIRTISRYVSQFAKDNDDACTRLNFVQEPSLHYLQQLCGTTSDDLLYEEVELKAMQVRTLAPLLEQQPDTAKYDYFLSCETEDHGRSE
jgi:hypothetical protein